MKLILINIYLFICTINFAIAQATFYDKLADSTMLLIDPYIIYDGAYVPIGYPNGDVDSTKGVCTDVIVRAYRKLGIDLQKEVHEDMKANFKKYPNYWGSTSPDRNIDHRRVPNLMVFFARHGIVKSITKKPEDYVPGDIVCWDLEGGMTHIGIVVNRKSEDGKRYMIVHNIGRGQVLADCLFDSKIIGHYRYEK